MQRILQNFFIVLAIGYLLLIVTAPIYEWLLG